MSYYTLPNLRSDTVTILSGHPNGSSVGPLPKFKDKQEFRSWCADDTTTHVFFSAVEGTVPGKRVCGGNPAYKLHGFVADYDAALPCAYGKDLVETVLKKSPGGMAPTYLSKTFSGKARAVWEFETPLLIDNERLAKRLMSALAVKLKARTMLAGYDSCSEQVTQYYEAGRDWLKVSDPISTGHLRALWFEAATKTRSPSSKLSIPMEVIAAKVDETFPGRWTGEFLPGARGPLFWINDGNPRVGCVVQSGGMWCYSNRAGKSFVSWDEIFGAGFTSEYKTKRLENALDDVWFDGKSYWVKGPEGFWYACQKEDFISRLKLAGFRPMPIKENHPATEIDEVLVHIQDNRRVHGLAPFIFNRRDTVRYNNRLYLNTTSHQRVLEPAEDGDEKKWPCLFDWWNFWLDGGTHHFLAWLQRFYRSAYEGDLLAGHTVIVAGNADLGKSLFSTYALPRMFSGGQDAGNYLMGRESFNRNLTENAVWFVDDNTAASDPRRFSEMLKKITATPNITVRAMRTDPVDVERRGRVLLTTNTDADSLAILPDLDGTILDKLMIFKLSEDYVPWFRSSLMPKGKSIQQVVNEELPHALRWLLDEYKPPARVLQGASPRYGVNPFHHSDIVAYSRDMSPDQRAVELLELWWKLRGGETAWEGSTSELLSELSGYEELQVLTKDLNSRWFGRTMAKLEDLLGPRCTKRTSTGRKVLYRLDLTDFVSEDDDGD